MKSITTRKIEQFVTKAGLCMLIFITLIGILFVFDMVCNIDIFPSDSGKKAFLVLCLIICVLIVSCVLVAMMLNISRIANAIEDIAKQTNE